MTDMTPLQQMRQAMPTQSAGLNDYQLLQKLYQIYQPNMGFDDFVNKMAALDGDNKFTSDKADTTLGSLASGVGDTATFGLGNKVASLFSDNPTQANQYYNLVDQAREAQHPLAYGGGQLLGYVPGGVALTAGAGALGAGGVAANMIGAGLQDGLNSVGHDIGQDKDVDLGNAVDKAAMGAAFGRYFGGGGRAVDNATENTASDLAKMIGSDSKPSLGWSVPDKAQALISGPKGAPTPGSPLQTGIAGLLGGPPVNAAEDSAENSIANDLSGAVNTPHPDSLTNPYAFIQMVKMRNPDVANQLAQAFGKSQQAYKDKLFQLMNDPSTRKLVSA